MHNSFCFKISKFRVIFFKVAAFFLISILSVGSASAAALSNMSDTLSSAKIGTASNHSFVFTTPTGIAAGSTTLITFPSEFVIPAGLSYTDVDINIGGAYTGSSTLGSTPVGTTIGVARISTTTILITNGTTPISAGSAVYIRIGTNALNQSTGVNQIVNATTTGNKSIGITGGTSTPMFDSGTTTVNMITNDTVTISATVLQSLTFAISTTTLSFGNLSNASAKYASSTNSDGSTVDVVAHTLTVSTNAAAGYSITVQGQTLTSQQYATNTISAIGATPATYAVGTEQFGIYATKSGGVNGTIDSTYATASSFGYDATATTSALFASGTTPTNTETYSLHYLASISALTEAGTYTANLVYVGTANF
jgi:hypothetical protein